MAFTDLVNSADSMDHDIEVMVVTDTVDWYVDMQDTVMVADTDQYIADTVESMEEATTMRKKKTLRKKGESMVFWDIEDMVSTDTVNLDVDMAGTGMEEVTD